MVLRSSGVWLDDELAVKAMRGLRNVRAFEVLAYLGDRLLALGAEEPEIVKLFAQGLIETGYPRSAVVSLERMLATTPADHAQHVDGLALAGRAYKQIYVEARRHHKTGGPTRDEVLQALSRSVRSYEDSYFVMHGRREPQISEWSYPAINLVAVLKRARRDGVSVDSRVDADKLADDLIAGFGENGANAKSAWDMGTLGEVYVAKGDWANAERWLREYASHPDVNAFQLAATIRQLEEVWQLEPSNEGPGRILYFMQAQLLAKDGGQVLVTPDARMRFMSTVQLSAGAGRPEAFLSDGRPRPIGWFRAGLERANSVGLVKHISSGNGFGTGFLVRGGDFIPRLGDMPAFLTNAHVISERPSELNDLFVQACHPKKAKVEFTEVGKAVRRREFTLREILWDSPRSELDACLVALHPTPEDVPVCAISDKRPEAQRSRVIIIGHPGGDRDLKVSLYEAPLISFGPKDLLNTGGNASHQFLRYTNPTIPGNSGSPVFEDGDWEVVGLHHAGPDPQSVQRWQQTGRSEEQLSNEAVFIRSITETAVVEATGRTLISVGELSADHVEVAMPETASAEGSVNGALHPFDAEAHAGFFAEQIVVSAEDKNRIAAERSAIELHKVLGSSGVWLHDKLIERAMRSLRNVRAFEALAYLGDRLLALGVEEPEIVKLFAQGLIETGYPRSAVVSLERMLATTPADHAQHVDGLALAGRAYKQIYVEARRHHKTGGPTRDAVLQALSRSVRSYEDSYLVMHGRREPQISEWSYPAINLVAVLKRARRDGVSVDSRVDADKLADNIVADLGENAAYAWDMAILGEAYVAKGDWANAERWLREYASHPDVNAFQLAATIRQLEEVWQLEPSNEGPGRILYFMQAQLLAKDGGQVLVTPDARMRLISAVPLSVGAGQPEALLSDGRPRPIGWFRAGLERANSVGLVKHISSGNGFGTGFLVRGGDFIPRLGDMPAFLTNAHVISERPSELNDLFVQACHPKKAKVEFTEVGKEVRRREFVLREILWIPRAMSSTPASSRCIRPRKASPCATSQTSGRRRRSRASSSSAIRAATATLRFRSTRRRSSASVLRACLTPAATLLTSSSVTPTPRSQGTLAVPCSRSTTGRWWGCITLGPTRRACSAGSRPGAARSSSATKRCSSARSQRRRSGRQAGARLRPPRPRPSRRCCRASRLAPRRRLRDRHPSQTAPSQIRRASRCPQPIRSLLAGRGPQRWQLPFWLCWRRWPPSNSLA